MKSTLSALAGRPIRLDLPDDFEAISKQKGEYERLTGEVREAEHLMELLEAKRAEAQTADTNAYAEALRHGKSDPGAKRTDAVDQEIVMARRKRAALERARDSVESEVVALVEEHRAEWLEEADEQLERLHERKRELLTAFAEERTAIVTTLSLRRWIEGFPTRPSVRRVGSPPVATLLGRNGEGLAWETILAALEADLETVREPVPATLAVPA